MKQKSLKSKMSPITTALIVLILPLAVFAAQQQVKNQSEAYHSTKKIPLSNKPQPSDPPTKCVVSGCNNELCINQNSQQTDDNKISTCQVKPEYACYKQADCEIQKDGNCGWSLTSEYYDCLKKINPKIQTIWWLNSSQQSCQKISFEGSFDSSKNLKIFTSKSECEAALKTENP